MEISLQMNTNMAKMAPGLNKVKYSKLKPHNNYKLETTISCRAAADHGGLAMHKKKANNFYEVFSLGSENNIQNVGVHEIKKAYRSMARQFHPDVCPTSAKEESTRKFIELQKAYETLSDPILRQKYDYQLGLVDSRQFGVDGCSMDEVKISIHRREVWEEQLCGLRKKSQVRMKKKKHETI